METFLTYLLSKIVEKPKAITVEKIEDEQSITVNVKLDQSDLAQVIGKKGRTIQALRTLLYTYLSKKDLKNKKVFLKVEENRL